MFDSETKKVRKFRRRKVLSLGFLMGISTMVWTGKWFKYIEIIEQKHLTRYVEFDEWNYQSYWGEWRESWEFVKLSNK